MNNIYKTYLGGRGGTLGFEGVKRLCFDLNINSEKIEFHLILWKMKIVSSPFQITKEGKLLYNNLSIYISISVYICIPIYYLSNHLSNHLTNLKYLVMYYISIIVFHIFIDWIKGCTEMHIVSLSQLRGKITEFYNDIIDKVKLREFYEYIFKIKANIRRGTLSRIECVLLWSIFIDIPSCSLVLGNWYKFRSLYKVNCNDDIKIDTWMAFFDWCKVSEPQSEITLEPMETVNILAIGDFGYACSETEKLADVMNTYVLTNALNLSCVFGLGDNFYPSGVASVEDKHFQNTWRDIYLKHPSLRVPWFIALGNHDYMVMI